MDDRPVLPTAQPLAELERIPAVTLLARPVRLHPHLVGVDHHGAQPHPRELPRGIERHGPGLEGDGCLRRQLVLPPQLPEALRRRRDVATPDNATVLRLDHEHTPLAVHVQTHVRFHRAALLLEFGAHCDPVVGRGPYRGGGQPAFIDTVLNGFGLCGKGGVTHHWI